MPSPEMWMWLLYVFAVVGVAVWSVVGVMFTIRLGADMWRDK